MLPDLGIAIHNNTITLNDDLTISLTQYSLSGCPLLHNDKEVEIAMEVLNHMASFVIPLSKHQVQQHFVTHSLLTFRIVEVMDETTASNGEKFRPIRCEMV